MIHLPALVPDSSEDEGRQQLPYTPSIKPGHNLNKAALRPLRSCFHRCTSDGIDLEYDRRIPKHSKLCWDTAAASSPNATPRSQRDAAKQFEPLSKSRSTQVYNGIEGISVSSAGSWLDCRAFRESCEAAGCSAKDLAPSLEKAKKKKGNEMSRGQVFILKRLKEKLLLKYGSLQVAWSYLNVSRSEQLGISEFVDRTSKFFIQQEAQIAYRCLDRDGDGIVDLTEFLDRLGMV